MQLLLGTCLVLAAASVAHADPAANQRPRTAPVASIAAIRAFAYHHESGTFGTDDLIEDGMTMNMPVEGDASGEASVMTLVQVEIAVPDGRNAEGILSVEVVADKKKVASRTSDLRATHSDKGVPRRVVPVLVYETGCEPLTIRATLKPPKGKPIKKTATLEFRCGE